MFTYSDGVWGLILMKKTEEFVEENT